MKRRTEEVEITVEFGGNIEVETGDDVFDHLLNTLLFYMNSPGEIEATWDLRHHLWEDTGVVLGKAIKEEIDEEKIARYGSSLIPMDEALVLASVDLSRPYLVTDLNPVEKETGFSLALTRQFFEALSRSLEVTIHLRQLAGTNAHHVIEAGFKALGNCLKQAMKATTRVESTKGGLK
ncbi:imidazoleglycerol-phosphate dehydratase HisB [Candidatus Bipolaricaulota bacterium]|nr:imidazoleglycerol-phosphate dehydratase HisB [Candidatus Bipolaricaulota bacterium]